MKVLLVDAISKTTKGRQKFEAFRNSLKQAFEKHAKIG